MSSQWCIRVRNSEDTDVYSIIGPFYTVQAATFFRDKQCSPKDDVYVLVGIGEWATRKGYEIRQKQRAEYQETLLKAESIVAHYGWPDLAAAIRHVVAHLATNDVHAPLLAPPA